MNMRIKAQREREVILELLGAEKPRTSLDSTLVWNVMATLGHPLARNDFIAHVDYLKGKGFLTEEQRHALGVTVFILRLTSSGRDLLDGTICDPGVGNGCP